MSQNIFKIYDGRTNFWQWDTNQKLIVLDERITEVRFSNRNMDHSKRRLVYTDDNGLRVVDVPDLLLQLPKNLIAYACEKLEDGSCSVIKAVKFAVARQPIPSDYVCEQDEDIEEAMNRLDILEATLREIAKGNQEMQKFESVDEASQWARSNQKTAVMVVVKTNGKWIAHMVEDDYTVTPICNCNGEMVEIDIYDGGDADGYEDATEIVIWDGGGAAGI